MATTGHYNIQEIRLNLNWSAINEKRLPKFKIEWADRISKPISVYNITAISGVLLLLLWLQYCCYAYVSQ